MKVTTSTQTVTRIEFEDGDTDWNLYSHLGELSGDARISIVNGGLVLVESE